MVRYARRGNIEMSSILRSVNQEIAEEVQVESTAPPTVNPYSRQVVHSAPVRSANVAIQPTAPLLTPESGPPSYNTFTRNENVKAKRLSQLRNSPYKKRQMETAC